MPPLRPPLNRPPGLGPKSFLRGLLIALAAVFAAQKVMEIWFGSTLMIEAGALSVSRLRVGYFWTVLTYALLHGGVIHLLCNLAGLFLVGRLLEESIGPIRLAALSLLGTLGAGLVWLCANYSSPGFMIGASGIGMAYLGAFVARDPRRPISFPWFQETVPVWWLMIGLVALDLAGLGFRAFTGQENLSGIAHWAHLGGLASGWLGHWLFLAPRSLLHARPPRVEPPRWATRGGKRVQTAYRVDLESPKPRSFTTDATRSEVDRLLDRINKYGYDTLSDSERAFLASAGRTSNTR